MREPEARQLADKPKTSRVRAASELTRYREQRDKGWLKGLKTEVGGAGGSGPNVPSRLYFFIVQGPSRCYDDETGALLQDDQAALAMAEKIMRELKNAGDDDYRGHVMIVKDARNRMVFSIPF